MSSAISDESICQSKTNSEAGLSISQLSSRGQERVDRLGSFASPKSNAILSEFKLFDAEKNPDGLINLGTAENSLLSERLLKFIHENFQMSTNHLKYRPSLLHGYTLNSTQVMPNILNKVLKPHAPIRSEHIVVGPGIGAILSHLIWHLCEAGDGVVITAPFYSDYIRDIIYPAQAAPIIVPTPVELDPLSLAVIPLLRQYIQDQLALSKVKIRVLMLCNPHNPLARAYPKETIVEYSRIAEEFNLHLIVDEVFANEIFSSRYVLNPTPFTSILSFPSDSLPCNPSRIHVLWSPSKDLGASGIKIGALISQGAKNKPLVDTIRTSLNATPVSSASDVVFTSIMRDEEFWEAFGRENRKRLGEAFELVGGWCESHGFGFEKAQAGPFVMIDFGLMIRGISLPTESSSTEDSDSSVSHTIQAKAKLAIAFQMLERGGIRLQSPQVYGLNPLDMRVRVVFTLPREIMKIALRRIEKSFGLEKVEV